MWIVSHDLCTLIHFHLISFGNTAKNASSKWRVHLLHAPPPSLTAWSYNINTTHTLVTSTNIYTNTRLHGLGTAERVKISAAAVKLHRLFSPITASWLFSHFGDTISLIPRVHLFANQYKCLRDFQVVDQRFEIKSNSISPVKEDCVSKTWIDAPTIRNYRSNSFDGM